MNFPLYGLVASGPGTISPLATAAYRVTTGG